MSGSVSATGWDDVIDGGWYKILVTGNQRWLVITDPSVTDFNVIPPDVEFDKLALNWLYGYAITSVRGLRFPARVKHLSLVQCDDVRDLDSLLSTRIEILTLNRAAGSRFTVRHCSNLRVLRCAYNKYLDLSCTTNLEEVSLRRTGKDVLDLLRDNKALRSLDLAYSNLDTLGPISRFRELEALDLEQLQKLATLDGLQTLPKLRELRLSSSRSLESISALAECKSLSSLTMYELNGVRDFEPLNQMHWLKEFRPFAMPKLKRYLESSGSWLAEAFADTLKKTLLY